MYLQPQRIDQIMREERLNEICASINVRTCPSSGHQGAMTVPCWEERLFTSADMRIQCLSYTRLEGVDFALSARLGQ